MKWCGALLLAAVAVCLAAEEPAGSPCVQEDGSADQRCERAQQAREKARKREAQCRQESNMTREEIKEYTCTLPTDADVRERVGKYSLCSSLIIRQVQPNGTLTIPKGCERQAAAAPAAAARPPSRCDILRHAAACAEEKEAEGGSSPEQRALAGRVCFCQAKRHAELVRRCAAPEVQEEPFCVEQRRRRASEVQCRKDSGLSARQLKDGRCKLPEEADVQEKLAKYSMCSLLNNGDMLSNGTTKMVFPAVNCFDVALTKDQPNRKKQERLEFACDVKRKFNVCREEKIAAQASGSMQEKKALAFQLCKCEAAAAIARHRRSQNETTTQRTSAK